MEFRNLKRPRSESYDYNWIEDVDFEEEYEIKNI